LSDIKEALEKFVIQNIPLEMLEDGLSEFNIFETLSLEYYEIRHSNTLSFLFDPKEKHALNDYFLKHFIIITAACNARCGISPVIIDGWDLSDSVIKREYKNIDILIFSKNADFVCCIENKILSSENNDQLNRYKDIIESDYPSTKYKMFIFLSPKGIEPSDQEKWLIADYDSISKILNTILKNKCKTMPEQQLIFLDHYNRIIRRYLLEDSEETKLAREIYSSHKKALDFIFRNIIDNRQMIYDRAVSEISNANGRFVLLYSTLSRIRFTTNYIDEALPKKGDKSWNNIEHVFVYEIVNNSDSLSLALVMGPADSKYRRHAFEKMKVDFIPKYIKAKVSYYDSFVTIYKKQIIERGVYENIEQSEIIEKLSMLFKESSENIFKEIDEYFKNNNKYYNET